MPTSRRRALITGATGFVGSHLALHLARNGWDVSLVVRPSSVAGPVSGLPLYEHDGTTDRLVEIVRETGPDVVFHLASKFVAEHRTEDVVSLVRSNIELGVQLCEAMQVSGTRLLVNTGTSWQHFGNSEYSPVCLYAATKQALESVLQYYIECRGIQVITLKLFDTYGVEDPRPKLFALLRRLADGAPTLAMSPGEQLIDLVHVDDVVRAFELAGERLLNGAVRGHERYAVSSGQPLSLKNLVGVYERVIGRSLPIGWGERPYREREVMRPWSEGSPVPGWSPRIGLEKGIRGMLKLNEQQ